MRKLFVREKRKDKLGHPALAEAREERGGRRRARAGMPAGAWVARRRELFRQPPNKIDLE